MHEESIDSLALIGEFTVGRITVTHVSDGVMVGARRTWFTGIDPDTWMPVLGITDPDTPFPVNFGGFLVHGADGLTLVDCGFGEAGAGLIEGLRAGGEMVQRLAEIDVRPEDVARVVVTHLHIDHCGHLVNSAGEPTFPNAEVWLHEAEVEYWESDDAEKNIFPETIRGFLKVIREAGLLRTYDAEREIAEGLTIVPAKGHTPGHTVVIVQSDGEYAFLLGDVVHHTVHFEHLDWLQNMDVEPPVSIGTRSTLFDRAVELNAIVTAVHMPILTLGRLTSPEPGAYRYTRI